MQNTIEAGLVASFTVATGSLTRSNSRCIFNRTLVLFTAPWKAMQPDSLLSRTRRPSEPTCNNCFQARLPNGVFSQRCGRLRCRRKEGCIIEMNGVATLKRAFKVGLIVALGVSQGCAAPRTPTLSPFKPFSNIQLNNCKAYQGFAEGDLVLRGRHGVVSFGPVQTPNRFEAGSLFAYAYQVLDCRQLRRAVRLLPIFDCKISPLQDDLNLKNVLITGGTAVQLSKQLGGVEQLNYRRQADLWSRVTE